MIRHLQMLIIDRERHFHRRVPGAPGAGCRGPVACTSPPVDFRETPKPIDIYIDTEIHILLLEMCRPH